MECEIMQHLILAKSKWLPEAEVKFSPEHPPVPFSGAAFHKYHATLKYAKQSRQMLMARCVEEKLGNSRRMLSKSSCLKEAVPIRVRDQFCSSDYCCFFHWFFENFVCLLFWKNLRILDNLVLCLFRWTASHCQFLHDAKLRHGHLRWSAGQNDVYWAGQQKKPLSETDTVRNERFLFILLF